MKKKNFSWSQKYSEDTKHYNSTIITNQIDLRKLYNIVYGSIQYDTPV
jgi:hypothetical protein